VGMLVYTFGYQGRDPQELLMLSRRHKAAIIDVRYHPLSEDKRWNKGALKRLFREHYFWIRDFASVRDVCDGKARIVNFWSGVKKLRELYYCSYILLCEEEHPDDCHRTTVAKWLDEEVAGFEYKGDMGNMDVVFVESVVFSWLVSLTKRRGESGRNPRLGFTKVISGWCVIPGCEKQPYIGIEMYGTDKEIRRMVDKAIQRRFAQAYVHVFEKG